MNAETTVLASFNLEIGSDIVLNNPVLCFIILELSQTSYIPYLLHMGKCCSMFWSKYFFNTSFSELMTTVAAPHVHITTICRYHVAVFLIIFVFVWGDTCPYVITCQGTNLKKIVHIIQGPFTLSVSVCDNFL